jgi:hypothetical protein
MLRISVGNSNAQREVLPAIVLVHVVGRGSDLRLILRDFALLGVRSQTRAPFPLRAFGNQRSEKQI